MRSFSASKQQAAGALIDFGRQAVDAIGLAAEGEQFDGFTVRDPGRDRRRRSLKNFEKVVVPFLVEPTTDAIRSASLTRSKFKANANPPQTTCGTNCGLSIWNPPPFEKRFSLSYTIAEDPRASFEFVASRFGECALALQADRGLFSRKRGFPDLGSDELMTNDVYGIILKEFRVAELGGVTALENLGLEVTSYSTDDGLRFIVQAIDRSSEQTAELTNFLPSTDPPPPPPERWGRHELNALRSRNDLVDDSSPLEFET
jgi:hypothetical protein